MPRDSVDKMIEDEASPIVLPMNSGLGFVCSERYRHKRSILVF
jgi:hypothetical protein